MGTHHFEVHGPGRDYDYSTFCEQCHLDAIKCATEWMAERFDGLDIGEDVSVTMKVVEGAADECYGGRCNLASQPAPHIVASTDPISLHCTHCGDKLHLVLPLSVDNLVRMERRYRARHVKCPKPSGGA